MLKYNVGDKAIFTKKYNNLDSGSVVTVEKVNFEYMPHIPYRVIDERGYGGWVKAEHLQPIQKGEAPMRKFKVGDKVEIIGNVFTSSTNEVVGEHYFDIGTVGVINDKVEGWGEGYYGVVSHGERWIVHAGDMTWADEGKEEVKEHKFLDNHESGKMDGWMVVELTDMEINFNLTKEQAEECVYKHIASGIDTENILVFAPNSNTRFEKSIKFFE